MLFSFNPLVECNQERGLSRLGCVRCVSLSWTKPQQGRQRRRRVEKFLQNLKLHYKMVTEKYERDDDRREHKKKRYNIIFNAILSVLRGFNFFPSPVDEYIFAFLIRSINSSEVKMRRFFSDFGGLCWIAAFLIGNSLWSEFFHSN